MMFCVVISEITGTLAPEDFELLLADSVSYPVKAHVNSLGALLFDSVINDPFGT